MRVFGQLFLGGADGSHEAPRPAVHRAVIAPRFARFGYEFGWGNTPRFEVSVHVALLDAGGQVELERTYDSGPVQAPVGVDRDSPSKAIDRATYVAIQRLMLRAAADVRTYLEARAPRGEGPHAIGPNPVLGPIASP